MSRFEELGLLREVTGQRRGRLFRYEPYLRMFDEPEVDGGDLDAEAEVTEGTPPTREP